MRINTMILPSKNIEKPDYPTGMLSPKNGMTGVAWVSGITAANRSYFGDFDLIFGAAKQNLKIVDLPIRYRERTYSATNISCWKHRLLLMRMVAFAARRIKFV